jgi:hypothetical protein
MSLEKHDDCEESNVERFTQEQAIQIARAEAKRDLSVQGDNISYVAYIPESHGYCLCGFVPHEGAWIRTRRLLTPNEWQAGEEIGRSDNGGDPGNERTGRRCRRDSTRSLQVDCYRE